MRKSKLDGKFTLAREYPHALHESWNAELEAQAQELASPIRARADRDILALARLLVRTSDTEVFGDTALEARHLVHHLGAYALSFARVVPERDGARASVLAPLVPPKSRRLNSGSTNGRDAYTRWCDGVIAADQPRHFFRGWYVTCMNVLHGQ